MSGGCQTKYVPGKVQKVKSDHKFTDETMIAPHNDQCPPYYEAPMDGHNCFVQKNTIG